MKKQNWLYCIQREKLLDSVIEATNWHYVSARRLLELAGIGKHPEFVVAAQSARSAKFEVRSAREALSAHCRIHGC